MTKSLAGMYAALMTALTDDGEFSPERQRRLDAYVLRQGLAGLYVGGSSGESGLLTQEELLAQQAVVAESAKGADQTLIAHVGMANLRDSIALARNAEALGYVGLSALPPHSYPFSDEEIFAYYAELSAATALPLIIYEVPARTGRPIPNEVLLRALELPGVGGLKFTSNDLFKFSLLRRAAPNKVFFFGTDEIFAAGGILGAHGGIGTTYNLLGGLYVALSEALKQSDLPTVQALQDTSQTFVEELLEVGVLPGMKAALRAVDIDCGEARLPMAARMPDTESRIASLIARPEIAKWILR